MQFRICHRLCCYSTCVVKVEERDEQCLLPLDETCPLIRGLRYNLVADYHQHCYATRWVGNKKN